jgi:hypothetical protein
VIIRQDTLRGRGEEYDITGADVGLVGLVPLDSVAAMESFTTDIDVGTSVAITTLVSGGAIIGAVFLGGAIFGSCPTIYSDSSGTLALEGEAFSYSIAPLFERRDVFRLRAKPNDQGVVSLEVRNEALETHYINYLQLLEVTHGANEVVIPDGGNHLLALSRVVHPSTIVDRRGRDLRKALANDDSLVFQTDSATLASATLHDLNDYIDLAMPTPHGVDSVAVVFDLRNSLLNTVMLYDVMLGPQGAHAVDWIAKDMNHISQAVALGRWYGSRMGMHISEWQHGHYEPVAYLPDPGPIAWRRMAAVVPVPPLDTLRLRLTFVADQWRIGSLAIAARVRRPEPRVISLSSVRGADGTADRAALRNLRDSDQRYLSTTVGQRFTARFDTGQPLSDSSRTFLLASQGYYLEWIRGSWIRNARTEHSFAPTDSTLFVGLTRWRAVHTDFERRFEQTRIPVR